MKASDVLFHARKAFLASVEREREEKDDAEARHYCERDTDENFGSFARAAHAIGLVASWDGKTYSVESMRSALADIAKLGGAAGEAALRALKD